MVSKANINALNFMQAAIGSQCKLMNRDVTCVLFSSLKFNLAAAFWINQVKSSQVSFIVNSSTCTVHTYRELKLRYSQTLGAYS